MNKSACPHCDELVEMEIKDDTTLFNIMFFQNRYAENSIVHVHKVLCPNCHKEILVGIDVGEWE